MKIYDHLIEETLSLLPEKTSKQWDYDEKKAWPQTKSSELILQRDAAYELGGNGKPSANFACLTERADVISKDEIVLYGPDLGEIRADCAYARIALISVEGMGDEGEELYRAVRDIDFIKYHVFPEGFMMRTSPESYQEQIRVEKKAVKKGISFENIGDDFIAKFKEDKNVKNVRLIFITDESAAYEALAEKAKSIDGITSALTTIMKGLKTDCATCQLKGLCDEVEGMKELHFGRDKKVN